MNRRAQNNAESSPQRPERLLRNRGRSSSPQCPERLFYHAPSPQRPERLLRNRGRSPSPYPERLLRNRGRSPRGRNSSPQRPQLVFNDIDRSLSPGRPQPVFNDIDRSLSQGRPQPVISNHGDGCPGCFCFSMLMLMSPGNQRFFRDHSGLSNALCDICADSL